MKSTNVSFVCVFVILSFITTIATSAQLNSWVRTHPDGPDNSLGGTATWPAFGADGQTYMRSDFGRYFRRADANAIWTQYTPLVSGQAIQLGKYFPHPTIPGQITASSLTGGVFRSVDSGDSWIQIAFGEFTLRARSPSDPTVFFAANNPLFTAQMIYKSNDSGKTWSSQEPNNLAILSDLEIDSLNSDIIYALDGQQIKKSINAGLDWVIMEEGTGSTWYMSDLAIDPINPQVLYAASAAAARVYRTSTSAASWTPTFLPSPLPFSEPICAVKVNPTNTQTVFAGESVSGAYRSVDGASNWTRLEDAINEINHWCEIGFSPSGAPLFTGNAGVAQVTSDDTLQLSNQGFSDFEMNIIKRDPSNLETLFAAGKNGLAVFDAMTNNWELRGWPLQKHQLRSLSINKDDAKNVIASALSFGLFETVDGGLTWQAMPQTNESSYVYDAEIAAGDLNRLYIHTPNGFYRSNDQGNSWQLILDITSGDIFVRDMEVSPSNPDVVVILTTNRGLFTTTDGGNTWSTTEGLFQNDDVVAVAFDPNNSATVYASMAEGYIWRSDDSAATWYEHSASGASFTRFDAIAVDSWVPNRIYGLNYSTQLYVYDPPTSWRLVSDAIFQIIPNGQRSLIPSTVRQGYVTAQAGGQLFSIQLDTDEDQFGDDIDNCTFVANQLQQDTDDDGYGNYCDPDYNNDLVVNFLDLAIFADAFLQSDSNVDLNGDNVVNFIDLNIFTGFYLAAPGPSSLSD